MENFKHNVDNKGLSYFTIPRFENTGLVKTCFTGRLGGVSQGSYSSLNLGLKTKDLKDNILENYRRVCDAIDIPLENLVWSDQVHDDKVIKVNKREFKNPFDNDINCVDGLITGVKDVALVTLYADCVPIFLFDPVSRVIGLVHAGWRGTAKRIASRAVNLMKKEFNTEPQNCLAAIGPSICRDCYEVDKEVVDKFNINFTNVDQFIFTKPNNKFMIDLWIANKTVLKEIGILDRNIIVSEFCTMCNEEILFSHRGSNGETGRMAAILQLI